MLAEGWQEPWPLANVGLIALHIVVLSYGVWLIKARGDRVRHPRVMVAAGVVFLLFLASFLLRVGLFGLTPLGAWPGPVQPRQVQSVHALVALVTVVVVARTYFLAFRRRFAEHKRLAAWAYALWVFTGLFGIVGHFTYPRL